jgi:hypothetical protein
MATRRTVTWDRYPNCCQQTGGRASSCWSPLCSQLSAVFCIRIELQAAKRTDRKGIGLGDVDWIQPAHDRAQWRALASTVMNVGLHERRGIYCVNERQSASDKYSASPSFARSTAFVRRAELLYASRTCQRSCLTSRRLCAQTAA